MNRKEHWENIYTTKQPHEVSWTQEVPQTSLDLIRTFNLSKNASIIDVGGGDSKLVDHLINEGYTNLTVLDISAAALERSQNRLGEKAGLVTWIVADINEFEPQTKYDLWHDRAVFHFLTDKKEIQNYVEMVSAHTQNMVVATFSVNGPLKCSGLEITQYDQKKMEANFGRYFESIQTIELDHSTPFGTTQNFIFMSWTNRIPA
ncbi:MAG: hypothetical protein RLZZ337_1760 [Bacteroidota bacterium]|jgi:2-polyprenyl-3-methyl-5-hydroxy-6-metoxy-1,4-benzoquinol methylase